MGKFDGILICTDFDCTLADRSGQGTVSKENIEAINFFMSGGGLFTLATGRQRKLLEKMKLEINFNAPLILINGTVVDLNGKHIYENPLQEEAIEDIYEIFENNPTIRESHLRAREISKVYVREKDRLICTQNAEGPYYKCIFLFDSPADCSAFMGKMKKSYGEKYEFDRSWAFEAEMHAKGSGKGDAVRFLRKYYGEKVNRVICVGDFENDVSMLVEADEGIAVANAMEEVKAVADRVTVSCEEHAIAKIIYGLNE